MSKAADVFGRIELVSFSAFFYVLGTVIEAASTNIQTYAGGQVIYGFMNLRIYWNVELTLIRYIFAGPLAVGYDRIPAII
jgi:hypothetical protein